MLIIFVIAIFLVNRTHFGRHIYAVGGNAQAARFSGINVSKVKFWVHTFIGIMAGIAGVVVASRLYLEHDDFPEYYFVCGLLFFGNQPAERYD